MQSFLVPLHTLSAFRRSRSWAGLEKPCSNDNMYTLAPKPEFGRSFDLNVIFYLQYAWIYFPGAYARASGCVCVCVSPPVPKGSLPSLPSPPFSKAGGQWSLQQSLPNKDTADRMWYSERTLSERTCWGLSQAVTLLFHVLIHGSSCFHPRNLGFAAELRRSFATAELCSHAQTACSTFQVNWLSHHAVPSPFSTWELSVTEYNCQSVFRSAVPLGCWVWSPSLGRRFIGKSLTELTTAHGNFTGIHLHFHRINCLNGRRAKKRDYLVSRRAIKRCGVLPPMRQVSQPPPQLSSTPYLIRAT